MKVRRSMPMTALGMVTGIVFAIIGFAIPGQPGGGPGVLFGIIGLAVAAWNGFHLLSGRGAPSGYEVDDNELPRPAPPRRAPDTESFDAKLRMLEALKNDGLITDAEYETKREQILGERW